MRPSDAVTQYLAALQEFYPASKGKTRVVVRPDHRVIVSTPLPVRTSERMSLFDQMAEVQPDDLNHNLECL